jgi:hypothetical protein
LAAPRAGLQVESEQRPPWLASLLSSVALVSPLGRSVEAFDWLSIFLATYLLVSGLLAASQGV